LTISSETRKAGPYTGNGLTTSFSFAFKVFTAADVLVIRTDLSAIESTLVLNTDYTVTLNSNQDSNPGGSVVLPSALATGYLLTLSSQVGALQATDLTNQGGFYPSVLNTALDKLTILVQQLKEQVSRSVKVDISSSITPSTLTGYIVALYNNLTSIITVSNNITSVNTNSTNIVAIQGASANASSAAASASSASTSATNANNSAVAAAASAASINPATLVNKDSSTGAAAIPKGTTAQRSVAGLVAGWFRFNTDLGKFEGYNGTAWGSVGGGATGGGSDSIFMENGTTMTSNYTLTTGKNAVMVGPLVVPTGLALTVPTGQRLVIL